MKLTNRVALVTGSARRVGRVIALALAGRGAAVAVHHLTSRKEAEETATAVAALGSRSMTVRADLAKNDEVAGMVEAVVSRLGGIDILVNSASVFLKTPLATVTEAEWDRQLDVNLKGAFFASLHAGRRMAERPDGGVIVNIADSAMLHIYRDHVPYIASQAGLVGMTRSMARSMAPKVRVNAIAPGPVVTPDDLPEEQARKIREKIPLKRHCTPDDVANAVVFLIEDGDYMTGTLLPVDGGRSLV